MRTRKTEPVSGARGVRTFLTADEAAAALGVRRRTLYTYASRGLLRRARSGGLVRYLAEDVRRLAVRADAHRGHTAVAASALRWGEPVLDTAISDVSGGHLSYRGRDAIALAESGATFEQAADLLLGGAEAPWPVVRAARAEATPGATPPGATPLGRLLAVLPALERSEAARAHDRPAARVLVSQLALALGARGPGRIAARLGRALGLAPSGVRALETALVLCADHELNASTFVARIAASAGASLGGSLAAALYTFTGRRHGAACERVEALLREIPAGPRGRARVRARLARGETIPGFGHPLYPEGDPRTAPILRAAAAAATSPGALGHALAVRQWVEAETGVAPSVDFGLVALSRALGLPDGHAIALFAIGRSAGWLAHALEQREAGELLRPRARYVGPPPALAAAPAQSARRSLISR